MENFGFLKPNSGSQLPASSIVQEQYIKYKQAIFFQTRDKYNFEFATAAEDALLCIAAA